MAYMKSLKSQQWLLPPSIEELIPQDHICFLVESVVESMNYTSFDKKYAGAGHPAYHPQIIIKLLIMAMLDGVRSSRKIDRLAKENVVYMYLAERLKPDFRTISDFRKNNPKIIEEIFKHTVILAKELGCVGLQHLSIDGSKIKASASNKKVISKKDLTILEEFVKNELKEGLTVDEAEDKLFGSKRGTDQLDLDKKSLKSVVKNYVKRINEKPESIKKIEKTIVKAKQELKGNDLNRISLTDPKARFIKHKQGGIKLSYNPQFTVDSKCGIIVANKASTDVDVKQLQGQIEQAEEILGGLDDAKISADNSYFGGENLKFLSDKNIDAYLPDQELAIRRKGKKIAESRFSKDKFRYDCKRDVFICPEDKNLIFKQEYMKDGKKVRCYQGKECKSCAFQKECTTSKKGMRSIKIYPHEKERREMVEKMKTAEAKEIYKMRARIVEPVIGHVKQNLGFREFNTRGETTKTEFNVVCIANNLRRIWNQSRKLAEKEVSGKELISN